MRIALFFVAGLALMIAGCSGSSTPANNTPMAEVQAKAAEQERQNPKTNASAVRRDRDNAPQSK